MFFAAFVLRILWTLRLLKLETMIIVIMKMMMMMLIMKIIIMTKLHFIEND